MKRSTRKVLAGVLIIGLSVGFLIYRSIATTSVYYLTVAELKTSPLGRKLSDQDVVRVGGKVVDGSVDYDQKNLVLQFGVRDDATPTETVAVRYEGAKPDAFAPNIEVLAEGIYVRGENLFRAQNLLVKCPSKYQSENTTR